MLSETAIQYKMFTLEQWKQVAKSISLNSNLSNEERYALLANLPSAALEGVL